MLTDVTTTRDRQFAESPFYEHWFPGRDVEQPERAFRIQTSPASPVGRKFFRSAIERRSLSGAGTGAILHAPAFNIFVGCLEHNRVRIRREIYQAGIFAGDTEEDFQRLDGQYRDSGFPLPENVVAVRAETQLLNRPWSRKVIGDAVPNRPDHSDHQRNPAIHAAILALNSCRIGIFRVELSAAVDRSPGYAVVLKAHGSDSHQT